MPRDVAEEAVQEALLQLVEMSARVGPTDVEGWLRRTAERRLIDAERHRRTQVPSSAESEAWDQAAVAPDMDAVVALRSSLRRLQPERRTLVVLRLSGASWREVAEATGLAEDVARKRFELALGELRQLMGDHERA
ncbi:MAG: sigma-70 family RNA polymerase sigma factor [Actinomycetota bacterium]|nr:sigma-70 family RNA polymerase sigma factor [Actinomycetota bacterium]